MAFLSIASLSPHGLQQAGIAHSHADSFGGKVLAAPARLVRAVGTHIECKRMLQVLGRHDDRVLADMGLDVETIRRRHEGAIGLRRFGPRFPKV